MSQTAIADRASALPRLRAGAASDDLSPRQLWLLVGGIIVLHMFGIWGLLQIGTVREALREVAPIFVSLLTPSIPPPQPLPTPQPPVPKPVPQPAKPVLRPPPEPMPMIATPATTAVAPFVAPVPEPAPITAPAAEYAPAATAAPAPQPPAPRRIPDSAVEFVEAPNVLYPRPSQRQGETGLTVVRAYVGTSGGAPHSVQIEKSSGHARLDQAALSAVQKARFKPYSEAGQPVEGWALIPIRFELEK